MRALQGTLAEQYAVVRQDRHWHAPDAGEAANQGGAVERLELVELRSVDDAADHLVHIVRRAHVVRDDAVKFLRIELRLYRLGDVEIGGLHRVQPRDDIANDRQRLTIILRDMIDDAGFPPM